MDGYQLYVLSYVELGLVADSEKRLAGNRHPTDCTEGNEKNPRRAICRIFNEKKKKKKKKKETKRRFGGGGGD